MAERISGQIARILSSTTLIINRGTEHGVKNGMKFIIFEEGDEITDPETGESMGHYEHVKGTVEVFNAQERMSEVRTPFVSTEKADLTLSTLMSEVSKISSKEDRSELSVKAGDISGIAGSFPISVGDKVRSID
ncbi:MAG TPA: hypothetical protein ENI27_08455 [bacterium]|nr:hypothetical protein [bacterium]